MKTPTASKAAAALGSIKSTAKAAAARENGKLGGRPASPQTLLDRGEVRAAVERAFALGWKTVSLGTDGEDGHVYRDTPLVEFAMRGDVIHVTRYCSGLEWEDCDDPATDQDFELPGYGKPWIGK
tara:strand:- start:35 stop:409 length:375 start_codon:yes stop_codon:yes gene_type:complete